MLPCGSLLDNQEPHGHLVQFYQADDALLTSNVVDFLTDGLKRGDALLVITTPERNAAFTAGLAEAGIDPTTAIRERKLLFADAEQTLRRFMLDGEPDWMRFERTIGALIREVRPQHDHGGLRAYGEMVGILWQEGQFAAAIHLEQLWNNMMSAKAFHLFCAYPIDVFGKDFDSETLDPLLCAHTHLVPAGRNQDLNSAVQRAIDDVLGSDAHALRARIEADQNPSWASIPEAESAILWLRNNLPQHADEILLQARQHYQATPAIQ
jgi:MEDS: MEthanogen/methylotroph, DcmR Sensory domain